MMIHWNPSISICKSAGLTHSTSQLHTLTSIRRTCLDSHQCSPRLMTQFSSKDNSFISSLRLVIKPRTKVMLNHMRLMEEKPSWSVVPQLITSKSFALMVKVMMVPVLRTLGSRRRTRCPWVPLIWTLPMLNTIKVLISCWRFRTTFPQWKKSFQKRYWLLIRGIVSCKSPSTSSISSCKRSWFLPTPVTSSLAQTSPIQAWPTPGPATATMETTTLCLRSTFRLETKTSSMTWMPRSTCISPTSTTRSQWPFASSAFKQLRDLPSMAQHMLLLDREPSPPSPSILSSIVRQRLRKSSSVERLSLDQLVQMVNP